MKSLKSSTKKGIQDLHLKSRNQGAGFSKTQLIKPCLNSSKANLTASRNSKANLREETDKNERPESSINIFTTDSSNKKD